MNALFAALINGALAGAAVTLAVWIVPRRHLNAATRYAIWWATLAVVILLPIFYLPIRWTRTAPPPNCGAGSVACGPAFQPVQPPARRPQPRLAPQLAAPRVATIAPPTPPIKLRTTTHWPRWFFASWALLTLVLLVRLVVSYILLDRLRVRASSPPRPLSVHAGRRAVRLAASSEIAAPVAIGPRDPTILIPARLFDELEDAELDQIALHEAADFIRRDDYALIAQRLVEALFAPHPLVRWITRRIDLEREIACDDLVVAATGRARSYARCLTRVVELSGGVRSSLAAAGAAEDGSHLATRVHMLLDKTRRHGARLLKGRLAAVALALAALAWVAARTPALVAFAAPQLSAVRAAAVAQIAKIAMLPQAAALPGEPSDTEGTVVEDSSGEPLASAELRFHEAGKYELAADLETDRAGRFHASGLPAGDYSADVSKPNHIVTSFRVHVPAGSLRVRLVRYGVIDGRATDLEGHPLPGRIMAPHGRTIGSARVTVLVKEPASGDLVSFRDEELQEGGHYRFFDLPPGEYAVGLWYSGLNQGSGVEMYPDNAHPRFFTVAGGEEYDEVNFVVTPHPAYSVSGKIALPEGTKGQFQMALGLPDQPTLPIAFTLTDDTGAFHFDKVPVGSYELFAAGPVGGYTAYESVFQNADSLYGRRHVNVSGQDLDGIDVPLGHSRSVSVTLRGPIPPGCPSSTPVRVKALDPWAIFFTDTTHVAAGKEQIIKNLAPGRFRITATELGDSCFLANDPVVDLTGDAPAQVALELAAAGSVRGVVHGSSTVTLVGAEAHVAFPDPQGNFHFDGLPPGHYRANGVALDVASGQTTTIELKEAH